MNMYVYVCTCVAHEYAYAQEWMDFVCSRQDFVHSSISLFPFISHIPISPVQCMCKWNEYAHRNDWNASVINIRRSTVFVCFRKITSPNFTCAAQMNEYVHVYPWEWLESKHDKFTYDYAYTYSHKYVMHVYAYIYRPKGVHTCKTHIPIST